MYIIKYNTVLLTRHFQHCVEFEKKRAMGGVGSVHTWVACLRGSRASVGYIVGVLTWVARLV